MIKVAIVDDDVRLCKALKSELLQFPEIESVYVSNSGLRFVSELQQIIFPKRPDVVIMDISMSTPDEGVKATAILNSKYPKLPIIVFTVADDDVKIFEAFKAGALGYLLKDEKPEFIVKTIHDVINGGVQMSPSIAKKAIRFFIQNSTSNTTSTSQSNSILTSRESEILEQVAKGHTYSEIASLLCVAQGTVKKHMANIFQKLNVRNKTLAVLEAKKFSDSNPHANP